jgi:uncharacterized membrane protein
MAKGNRVFTDFENSSGFSKLSALTQEQKDLTKKVVGGTLIAGGLSFVPGAISMSKALKASKISRKGE